ncbi:HAMP domain-containing sensor histidine kinase [Paenibacillus pinistramenti]|uniref:HAMP domain-containing sensor histidine kinase n=1 Tax=Paenibacillus pinistramenti TaxID=1768003 RepID=UPI0011095ECD|nr:ATP-binding protein [Paenibacillus pinistramenti]
MAGFWRSLVGKLWLTISALVACVLLTLGLFLLPYIDTNFTNSGAIKTLFIWVSVAGFALTTFFALFLFTKITQPMRRLIQAADQIRTGHYDTRLTLRTSDEIGDLASTFNHMAEELENTIRSLNLEKEHLASVLRSMNDAVITIDHNGAVILTNPPAEELLHQWGSLERDGGKEEEGREAGDLIPASLSPVPEPLVPMFRRVFGEKEDQREDIHVKQTVWSVHMTPLTSEGDIQGAVAVLRDVTEQAQLEKMRKDFVANVSHEIRTPLSMMQGYSEALLDGMASTPEEERELIQVIQDESIRMGRLVHDLLDLARMEAGHTEMEMHETDLNELMERMYRKFAVRAKERSIQLQISLPQEPLILREANEDRLEQVLTNLLDNAFRHTPENRRVSMAAQRTAEGKGQEPWIEITVSDEGHGIAADDLPYIFERFYKADKARVRGESAGTGLGLSIVKNIVVAHHGTITAESEVGRGTVFRLQLPVEKQS